MALFKKKNVPQPQEPMDIEAVMKKYDRESNTRVWEGAPKIVVTCILAIFSLFCIYVTLFASWLEETRLTTFMAFIVFLGYLVFPVKKGTQKVNSLPWYDIVLMVLGAGAFLFYSFNAKMIVKLNMRVTRETLYIIIGAIGMLVLAELCRRSVGLPILCVAGVFMVYTLVTLWNKGGIPLIV